MSIQNPSSHSNLSPRAVPPNTDALEQRIEVLESKLSYQQATSDDLDLQVQKLNNIVEKLELYCRRIDQKVGEVQESVDAVGAVEQQIPPHY